MSEMAEWQKEFVEYFEKQSIEYKIDSEKQITLIFDSYKVNFKNFLDSNNKKIVWVKLYKIKNSSKKD